MMAIIRNRRKDKFSIINNDTLNDDRLSFKARGLLAYMLSKPDDWQFYVSELQKHSQKDGRRAIESALKEIQEAGYLQRKQMHKKDGSFDKVEWLLTDRPAFSPQAQNVQAQNVQAQNVQLLNTDNTNNLLKLNTNLTNDWLNDINLNLLTEKVNEAEQQWGNLTPEIKECLVGLTDQFGQQVVADGIDSFNDSGQHKSGLLKYVKKYIKSRRDSNAAQSLKLEASLRKLRR